MPTITEEPMTTIRLGGYLGRRFGNVRRLAGIHTIQQAVDAINYQSPGFKKAIEEKEGGPHPYKYHVRVNKRTIGEEKLGLKITGKTLHITPVPHGRSTKGVLTLVAGVVLIVVGALLSEFGGEALVPYGVALIGAGVGYAFSGIASLIAGTPNTDAQQNGKAKNSYAFSGPVNQTQQGGAIGLHYGENWIGSQTVSGSITPTVVITNATASGNTTGSGGGGGGGGTGPSRPVAAAGRTFDRNAPARPIAVIGGRGGGSSGSTPTEAKISLISNQTMQILDCLGEGEVEGLGDEPLKNFALNGTPVMNPDGTLNFKGIEFYYNTGTQDQNYIPGFTSEADTTQVNVELKQQVPWVQHFSNLDLNAVQVVVQVPALEKYSSNGNIDATSVVLQFELSTDGGAYQILYTDTISGYTPNAYTRGYEIPLDSGTGPWDVRITRITDDSSSAKLVNKTVIFSKSEIIYGKFRHPNRVMSGLRITADQFDGPPTRMWNEKGLKVQVPTNFDPIARTYAGGVEAWDGTWKVAYTNDPAWCWRDLLLNTRYGLGRFLTDSMVNRFALARISLYCSQLIPDSVSAAGTQFRHSMNLYIQNRDEALKQLSDMASNFRAMLYYINGEIVAVQDRAADYIAANYGIQKVINGAFTYAGVPARNRHNTVYTTYSNPDDMGKPDIEPAEDQKDIAQNGIIDDSIVGIGIATRGEARRAGEYEIITELIQDETITFKTGFNGGYRMPGDVIAVSNPFRSGERVTGLVTTVDGNTVTLDRAITLVAGKNYQLSVVQAGNDADGNRITQTVQRAITTAPGVATNTLTIAAPFDGALPTKDSQYIIVRDDLQPELWRVMTVTQDGIQSHEITALKYNASKYDAIDRNFHLEYPPVTTLPNPIICKPPGTVTVREVTGNLPLGVAREFSIAWEASPDVFIQDYKVSFNLNGGNWTDLAATTSLAVFLPFTAGGKYNFQVFARNVLGAFSAPATASYTVSDENPLAGFSVSGLELAGQANNTDWTGLDAKFDWRLNSAASQQDIGSETNGAASGDYDPTFKDFKVSIIDPETNLEVWTEYVSTANYTFTFAKNGQAFGTPRNAFTIEVRARDIYNDTTDPATLTVSNPPPAAPSQLTAVAAFQNVFLEFVPATDLDLAATEVLCSTTGDIVNAVVFDAGLGTTFVHSGVQTGQVLTYWVRSRDTFGNRSNVFPTGNGVVATPGTVQATDLAAFAVNLTGAFGNTIVLQGDEWQNHTQYTPPPANPVYTVNAGSIAWNAHQVFWQGKAYQIAAGSTTQAWVYWHAGDATYLTSETNPSTAVAAWSNNNYFQIAANDGGVFEFAWYGFANAVIGSAYIANLAVTNAQIANLAADKLLANSAIITLLRIAAGGSIQSDNYAPGLAGFSFGSDGILRAVGAQLNGELRAGILDTNCQFQNSNFPGKYFPVVSFGSQKVTYTFADTGVYVGTNKFITPTGTIKTKPTEVLILDGVEMFGVGYDPATIPDGNRRLSKDNQPLALQVSFSGNFGSRATLWYRTDPGNPWTLIMKVTNPVTAGTEVIYVSVPADSNLQFAVSTCNQNGGGVHAGADYIYNGNVTVIAFNI